MTFSSVGGNTSALTHGRGKTSALVGWRDMSEPTQTEARRIAEEARDRVRFEEGALELSSQVVLVDIGEFSYADAAQILDIPIGTVMSRLHRARRILKGELAEEVAG